MAHLERSAVMNTRWALILAAVVLSGCSRHQFKDDEAGVVTRVYKAISFSAQQPSNPKYFALTFVRVDADGTVHMKFKVDNGKVYDVHGVLWQPLAGEGLPLLDLVVVASSVQSQTASIEYRAYDGIHSKQ